ncbi:MAG: hypothetical protein COA63_007250 [Methylophaga sp.]|nr:hypothetical protein [Methylophaga sp.]
MYDKLVGLLSEGQYSAFAIAIALGVLFNASKILNFFDGVKKRRIDLLKEASSIRSLNENLKNHFEDEIEGEYFSLIHKVKMDKGLRDACIALYKKAERRLPFVHFLRAKMHLYLELSTPLQN